MGGVLLTSYKLDNVNGSSMPDEGPKNQNTVVKYKRKSLLNDRSLNIDSLIAFLKVVDLGNISKAARELGVTQSAISQRLKNLENDVGEPLFVREFSKLRLTATGRILKNRAREIASSMENLFIDILARQSLSSIDLKIGFSTSVSRTISPYFFKDLIDKLGSVRAFAGNTPSIAHLLQTDIIDIGILTEEIFNDQTIQCIPLYREKFVVLIPSIFDSNNFSKPLLMELSKQLPCVSFNSMYTLDAVISNRFYRSLGIKKKVIEVDGIETALSIISSGKAWSLMPALNVWSGYKFIKRDVSIHTWAETFRVINLIYKDKGFESLAGVISEQIKACLRNKVLPEIKAEYPQLGSSIQIL